MSVSGPQAITTRRSRENPQVKGEGIGISRRVRGVDRSVEGMAEARQRARLGDESEFRGFSGRVCGSQPPTINKM